MSKLTNRDLEIIERQAYAAKADNATCVEAVTPDAVLKLISTVREIEEERECYKKAHRQIKADWNELIFNVHQLVRNF